jgi:hypothetical protein
MNAMAPIEGLEGSGKPLFHISGSSVIADNARDGYASNHIFEDLSQVTPYRQGRSRGYRSTRA